MLHIWRWIWPRRRIELEDARLLFEFSDPPSAESQVRASIQALGHGEGDLLARGDQETVCAALFNCLREYHNENLDERRSNPNWRFKYSVGISANNCCIRVFTYVSGGAPGWSIGGFRVERHSEHEFSLYDSGY